MSNQEPLSKKQRRSNGDETASSEIVAFGGPMYDEATALKILKEAVDDDKITIAFGAGFDPDGAALDNTYEVGSINGQCWGVGVTPMIFFARKGNAKMCRYLISRGASTTAADDRNVFFPLYAAVSEGQLDVCKVLYESGAQNDVRRRNNYDQMCYGDQDQFYWTPFTAAAYHGYTQVLRWLVLHGALCADNSSEDVEGGRIQWENWSGNMASSCNQLVVWAEEVTQSHSALLTFLGGTLPLAPTRSTDQRCILPCLSGHSGVRKHIDDFVGLEVTKGKHLRILENVKKVLPPLLERRKRSRVIRPYLNGKGGPG